MLLGEPGRVTPFSDLSTKIDACDMGLPQDRAVARGPRYSVVRDSTADPATLEQSFACLLFVEAMNYFDLFDERRTEPGAHMALHTGIRLLPGEQ
jgi:hypothetical protein